MKQMKKAVSKRAKKKDASRQSESASPWLIPLRCLLFTLLFAVFWIVAVAVGLSFLPDPGPMIRPFALLVAGLTALFGGWLSARQNPHAPILSSAVNGLLLTALMLIGSLALHRYGNGYPPYLAALLHTSVILLSLLGALFVKMRRGKRRSRSRRG